MVEELSFLRYLAAKQAVDDRSLNAYVWDALGRTMADHSGRLKILEIGAGSGAMIERLLKRGHLRRADYTAVDVWGEGLNAIPDRLKQWAEDHGWSWRQVHKGIELLPPDAAPDEGLAVTMVVANALDYARHPLIRGRYDLLIAHAVLDLLDLPTALPILLRVLKPGGFCYFSLNFDGVTSFLPILDRSLDDLIEHLYHRTMDERLIDGKPSGDHRAGRHLLALLRTLRVDLLAVGGSDWIVHAVDGRYRGDEAYFLRHILHFVESSLRDHSDLPPDEFANWLRHRHDQIDRGELIYIAHQVDLLGKICE
ncbi:MAG: class I SAM-dependent methyltransferase [Caldilineaceae bacterium]|nr:class I SAM-dependent methyltransferase [Caldilineaceae bacterium]